MRHYLLIPLVAFSLGGCTGREILAGIAAAGGAAVGAGSQQAAVVITMDQERMRDKVRLATAEGNRMADYFEDGKLPASTSPDTAHKQFCPMVIAEMAEIGSLDDGGNALAQGCWIRYYLGKAKSAYEDGIPVIYDDNLSKADGAISRLTAILNRYKGASQ